MKYKMRWDTIILFFVIFIILVVIFVLIGLGHPEYLADDIQEKILILKEEIQYWQEQLEVLKIDYARYCSWPEHVLSAEHLGNKRNLEKIIPETQEAVTFKIRELKEMRDKANLFLEASKTIKRTASDVMEASSSNKR